RARHPAGGRVRERSRGGKGKLVRRPWPRAIRVRRCDIQLKPAPAGDPMLTLYGDLDSGNVYKVRLLLAQLGIAPRRVDTTQNRGETATAQFRTINPIGKIPTIVFDDGRMLSESGAILYFLGRDTAFFAADAWDQADVLRWMFFEQYSHEPYIA